MRNATMTPFEWAMLIALSVVWDGSFFFTAIAVKKVPPMSVAVIRVAGAALAILLGVLILGETLRLNHLAGLAIIGAGLAAIDGRIVRRFYPSKQ